MDQKELRRQFSLFKSSRLSKLKTKIFGPLLLVLFFTSTVTIFARFLVRCETLQYEVRYPLSSARTILRQIHALPFQSNDLRGPWCLQPVDQPQEKMKMVLFECSVLCRVAKHPTNFSRTTPQVLRAANYSFPTLSFRKAVTEWNPTIIFGKNIQFS